MGRIRSAIYQVAGIFLHPIGTWELRRWNVKLNVAFWACNFFARMAFGNAYLPATVFAVKINDSRFGRYSDNFAALWTFPLPANVPVPNPDFLGTEFAEKPNHKAFSLVSALLVLLPG